MAAPSRQRHHASERTTPRLEVVGQIHGQALTFNTPLVVRDLSGGGFSVESAVPFGRGTTHVFRFTTNNGASVVLRANAMHSRPVAGTSFPERFTTGFQFLTPSDERTAKSIDALLDAATSVLQFD
jgi:hypothetical protein